MKKLKVLANSFIFYFVLLEIVSSEVITHVIGGNRLYLINTEENFSWFEAYQQCKSKNSKFVSIDTKDKNDAIVKFLKSRMFTSNLWLGAHDKYHVDKGHKQDFIWSATGAKFEFSYWSDNNEPHCVHISKGNPEYRWNVADCSTKMGFICELTS